MSTIPTLHQQQDRQILPSSIIPSHYSLSLTPDLSTFTFTGHVTINLSILESTNTILLNAKDLDITSASIIYDDIINPISTSNISLNDHDEIVSLTFPMNLPITNNVSLSITYKGIHNDKMAGFYRSTYKDNDGIDKVMVVTQFEATDARRAFPCWDEPAHKATFDVILNVSNELTALSNMNVISEDPHSTLSSTHKVVKFARTPLMSTYLLAFAVGEFEYIESKTSPSCTALPNPVTVRVYTTKGETSKGKFGLACAVRILEYFSQVFGEPYPLPKMDMIAVPDFSAGAMENWGLVTYRTIYLLFDEKTSSVKTKQGVAYVVAHELAHQWFGNLVTMSWWDELWLNEGFATWVGWLAVDALFPDWSVWTSFVADDMNRALSLDGLRSSHPIQVPVKVATEISQIFDAISYSKGASAIRMLSSWLTQEVFLAGIRAYIQRHKYKNATTNDLWTALSEASGLNVNEFMSLWTTKVGYPVLHVERHDNMVHIRQERFLSAGNVKPDENETIWWCPLNLYTGDENTCQSMAQSTILKSREGKFSLPAKRITPIVSEIDDDPTSKGIDFYKINRHQANFYRVKYSSNDLENLGKVISQGKGKDDTLLSTADRVGLVSDTFALASAGYMSTVDVLRLLQHFDSEKYIVLSMVAEKLGHLKTVWTNEADEITDRLQVFTRKIFSNTATSMGWDFPEGETQLNALLRTLAISVAGTNGDKTIVAEAKSRFNRFIADDLTAIHPNLRGAVYGIVLKHANYNSRTEYDAIKKIWETEALAMDQRLVALSALGRHPNPELSTELLDYTLNSGHVRLQDYMYPLRSVASNPKTRHLAWKFVQDNWNELVNRFKSSLSLLSHCVSISADWADEEFANTQVKQFFINKDTSSVDRALQQSLEKISAQAQWLNRDRKDVAQWLMEHVNL